MNSTFIPVITFELVRACGRVDDIRQSSVSVSTRKRNLIVKAMAHNIEPGDFIRITEIVKPV